MYVFLGNCRSSLEGTSGITPSWRVLNIWAHCPVSRADYIFNIQTPEVFIGPPSHLSPAVASRAIRTTVFTASNVKRPFVKPNCIGRKVAYVKMKRYRRLNIVEALSLSVVSADLFTAFCFMSRFVNSFFVLFLAFRQPRLLFIVQLSLRRHNPPLVCA